MSRRPLALVLLFLVTGCSFKGCSKVPVIDGPDDPTLLKTTNGLTGADQQRWRHLAEGSELFPLSWILALEDSKTGKPFLEEPNRFGLLADVKSEENPYRLPIGVTADYTRDLRFAGVQMIGINCAACHVSELYYKGKPVVRIDGAPSVFDFELFLRELARVGQDTLSDPAKIWKFVKNLYVVYNPPSGGPAALTRLAKPADLVLRSYDTLGEMKEGNLGKRIAKRIEAVNKEEAAAPAADLNKGLIVRPKKDDAVLGGYVDSVKKKAAVAPTAKLQDAARDLRPKALKEPAANRASAEKIAEATPTRNTPLAKAPVPQRVDSIADLLDHVGETVRLMKARIAFVRQLANSGQLAHTAAGFGRVDAFGSARNRFFPDDKKPTTAPISYPHLWDLNQLVWLHWDANTTSVLERNAGQAVGLGALFDPDTFESTLVIEHLEALEVLARKIEPPKWPAQFGEIKPALAARGKKHFGDHCLACHAPVARDGKVADKLRPLDEIGTDPTRAENFAQPADGKPFDVALSGVLKKLVREAGGKTPDEKLWRVTRQYPDRPLTAVWATAPYLHNNSVPTLHDLLLPAAQRPKTFAVGHRVYDPDKVGYAAEAGSPSFTFDTAQTGNGNGGHEYGTGLTDTERKELLEYLKTL